MFKATVSSLLKRGVAVSGLQSWWEQNITSWPRVIFYHHIADKTLPFLNDISINKDDFLEHIAKLRQRYRFLTWQEYKEALGSPQQAQRSILLTFDDGFDASWMTMEELAADHRVPSVFFLNTRVLDNAYAPWTVQYYFLRTQSNGKFLEPLWKSISNGTPLLPADARERCHRCFSLSNVIEPLEEGLASFGMTPAELAHQYQLYISSAQIPKRTNLLGIGNHSHSHYILSRLNESELQTELQLSHDLLTRLLGAEPECFAYPFGIPDVHFDEQCQRMLAATAVYPYIFSGSDTLVNGASRLKNIARPCLDKVKPRDLPGTVAKITPRTLTDWLIGNSSRN